MAAHILLSPVGQKTETRFNCFLTENRKSAEMMVEARCYQNDSWSARRVIGATAKPLYPIDGKAEGLDRRSPQTSLFEGGGPPRRRWKEYRSHLTPSVTAAPCQTFGVPLACLPHSGRQAPRSRRGSPLIGFFRLSNTSRPLQRFMQNLLFSQ